MFKMKREKLGRINHQVFLITIFTITIPLLIISTVLYLTSVNGFKTQHENSSQLILTNLSFNIDQYLQSIEKGTLAAITNEELQLALENWPLISTTDQEELKIQYEKEIEDFAGSLEVSIKNIDSVQIFSENRVFYSTNFNRSDYDSKNFVNKDWYKQTIEARGKVVLFGTHKPFQRPQASNSVISIARVINKAGSKQALSVVLIDIRLDSLQEILNKSETTNRNFIILDKDNQLIYASDLKLNRNHLKDIITSLEKSNSTVKQQNSSFYASINNSNSFVNFVHSNYSGWKVIQYVPVHEITKYSEEIQFIIFALAFMSFVTAIILYFILKHRVTKPIISLSHQVKQVGLGNFVLNLNSNRNDEFGVLHRGISQMVSDLEQQVHRLSDAKVQQKMAQYGALKSQINPHFLANTLETIQMKVIINGDRETSEMVGKLGMLFRGLISSGKETLKLREELEQLRLYISIQQFRFANKMTYEENLAEEILDAEILHFILQPIVENAFVHGLERKLDPGVIRIISQVNGKFIKIIVEDNGIGLSDQQLCMLQEKLDSPIQLTEENHVGLKNVHDRICFYYGEQYGLLIESQENVGTRVVLTLPYIKKE